MDALLIEKIKDIMRDNAKWNWRIINKELRNKGFDVAPSTIRKYKLYIIRTLGIDMTARRDMIKKFKEMKLEW